MSKEWLIAFASIVLLVLPVVLIVQATDLRVEPEVIHSCHGYYYITAYPHTTASRPHRLNGALYGYARELDHFPSYNTEYNFWSRWSSPYVWVYLKDYHDYLLITVKYEVCGYWD